MAVRKEIAAAMGEVCASREEKRKRYEKWVDGLKNPVTDRDKEYVKWRDSLEVDEVPLSKRAQRDIENVEFITWEEMMRDLGHMK